MPYKSEKIIIAGGKLDKRCKLTEAQKTEIIALHGTISERQCAERFGVSRRTIQFLWFPEKLIANKQARAARGGWRQYYDKKQWADAMREHRHYKQELYEKGMIG